jgi:hypothetical protein
VVARDNTVTHGRRTPAADSGGTRPDSRVSSRAGRPRDGIIDATIDATQTDWSTPSSMGITDRGVASQSRRVRTFVGDEPPPHRKN